MQVKIKPVEDLVIPRYAELKIKSIRGLERKAHIPYAQAYKFWHGGAVDTIHVDTLLAIAHLLQMNPLELLEVSEEDTPAQDEPTAKEVEDTPNQELVPV